MVFELMSIEVPKPNYSPPLVRFTAGWWMLLDGFVRIISLGFLTADFAYKHALRSLAKKNDQTP